MQRRSNFRFDAATGLSLGRRDNQEDAVLCDIPRGSNAGLVVLADGLGGHAAGAVASRIAVSSALNEAAAHRDPLGGFYGHLPDILTAAAKAANSAILRHTASFPETRGMGATLVILALLPDRVHWLSIGDSPFYLSRGTDLIQLNATHSLACQLDLLVRAGEMAPETAAHHPDRHCLTSALGEETIAQIDCPQTPLLLRDGDSLLLASDGILSLPPAAIQSALLEGESRSSGDMANRLLKAVAVLDLPDQDNLSVAVIRACERVCESAHPVTDVFESSLAATRATFLAGWRDLRRPGLRARRAK